MATLADIANGVESSPADENPANFFDESPTESKPTQIEDKLESYGENDVKIDTPNDENDSSSMENNRNEPSDSEKVEESINTEFSANNENLDIETNSQDSDSETEKQQTGGGRNSDWSQDIQLSINNLLDSFVNK